MLCDGHSELYAFGSLSMGCLVCCENYINDSKNIYNYHLVYNVVTGGLYQFLHISLSSISSMVMLMQMVSLLCEMEQSRIDTNALTGPNARLLGILPTGASPLKVVGKVALAFVTWTLKQSHNDDAISATHPGFPYFFLRCALL